MLSEHALMLFWMSKGMTASDTVESLIFCRNMLRALHYDTPKSIYMLALK